MNTDPIISIKEKVNHWPDMDAEHFRCTLLGKNNVQYDADIHKTEVELNKFLTAIKHKLTQSELAHLRDLIDDYGQRQYEEGGNSEAMSHE